MHTIRLRERTSVAEILKWQLNMASQLQISRSSSFEPGAQGLAFSALRGLMPLTETLEVLCDFAEPKSLDECQRTIFGTPFGFSLARFVKNISFESQGTPASSNFKPLLGALYKATNGCIGLGTQRALVSADPAFPLPSILLTPANSDGEFPAPSTFLVALRRMAQEIGLEKSFHSRLEASLLSFVYEGFRNSLEHGLPAEERKRGRSTRAVILEKLLFGHTDIQVRDLSSDLKAYAMRLQEGQLHRGGGIVCVTVCDQGDGIARTLPAVPESEPSNDRFARAFREGESRKPPGMVSRGLGLPSMVAAAGRLQALVRIQSGDQSATQDFSLAEEKYPALKFDVQQQRHADMEIGTTFSIFLPVPTEHPDQERLFRR